MKAIWQKQILKLKHPFHLSYGTVKERTGYLIELRDSGFTGRGECVAVPYYIRVETLAEEVKKATEWINAQQYGSMEGWRQALAGTGIHAFVRSAVDCALWNLEAAQKGVDVYDLLGLHARGKYLTSRTLSGVHPGDIISGLRAHPWPVYKLKVGFEGDMELVDTYYKHHSVPLRLDANGGWSYDEAVDKLQYLRRYEIEHVEQPLGPQDLENQQRLYQKFDYAFVADEFLRSICDLAACRDAFHMVNVKLIKCGGITPVIDIIKAARKQGLGIMIGCMTETSVGITAGAQLLPLVDIADLDGNLLINDPHDGIKAIDGYITLQKNK